RRGRARLLPRQEAADLRGRLRRAAHRARPGHRGGRAGGPGRRRARARLAQPRLAAPGRLLRGMVTSLTSDTTSDTTPDFIGVLAGARLLAIIRGSGPGPAVAAGTALLGEGVRVIEVSLTTPGALDAIAELRAAAPAGALVGAGTVLTESDVADVAAAGAQFAVTPAVVESVGAAVRRGLPVAAGALTPTEAHTAVRLGADAVKVFPASLAGPAYIKALRQPFPRLPFVAV